MKRIICPIGSRNGNEGIYRVKHLEEHTFEIEEYLGNKEKEIKDSNLDDTFAHGEIEDFRELKRQMDKLRKEMSKWYDRKKIELSDKNDMKIETSDFLNKINESLMESLDVDHKRRYEILEKMISLLYKVTPEELSDDEETETTCSRIAYMLEICIEYRDNSALALVIDRIPPSRRESEEK